MALFREQDLPIWEAARPYLDVRNNDEHTLIAYALGRMLLEEIPDADENIVLPAIILHDVGWKQVPEDLLLLAVGRKPTRLDLVRDHELYSVEIAREILQALAPNGADIDAICEIIDGHDTTKDAKNVNDAVLKDADKAWRSTPHGMRTIAGWYGVPVSEVVLMLEERSNPHMLTPAGRALAEGQTRAVKTEGMIEDYLGHGPEFAEFVKAEGKTW